ncbi:hypothetical protein DZC73_19915 [Albitalea terrae]|uniref:DUF5666 domain-containing protein n=1 Tax=Piscinibacter terrae TaxID=2496871 RepID=A0A3N7IX57_9BURK|nr:hypothetical protein DZC73_19915 [Albitalea terrae]
MIVNGVRFDDSTARVSDDDDATHDRTELKLGMTVDVQGGTVSTDSTSGASSASASAIQFHSEVKGPVEAVDAAAGTLTVLGQSVVVDAATVFDGITGGLTGLSVGAQVEVFALVDGSTQVLKATRLEAKSGLAQFKLRGTITALDTTAKTFKIGSATIGYGAIAAVNLPALADGVVVRVQLQTSQQSGIWIATSVRSGKRAVPDSARSEVEGIVTDFVSLSNFNVGGISVDASSAGVSFDNGNAAAIANGVRLEVHGTTANGVLTATRIEFKLHDGDDLEIELHGTINSADALAHTFTLRGQTVSFDDTTRIDGGTAAGLVVGASVEVRGSLAADGAGVVATRIKFER